MSKNKIYIYTDLEGTLTKDNGNLYDDEHFYNLLSELDSLGKILDSDIDISILSPMPCYKLNNILKNMDNSIMNYKKITNSTRRIDISKAITILDKTSFDPFARNDRRIVEVPYTRGVKAEYLKFELDNFKIDTPDNLCIYFGDGNNDLEAMKIIKKCHRSLVLSPNNSSEEVKKVSDFTSGKNDILGIIDCIRQFKEKLVLDNNETVKENLEKE